MKFIISGKNIEITQGLRSAVESKIGKLDKYFYRRYRGAGDAER